MLLTKNWQGTTMDQHELICGNFVSRYLIDEKECYESQQRTHKFERAKFNRYIDNHWDSK